MTYALLIVGNGRAEYLTQAVTAARDNILVPIKHRVMVNDWANADYMAWLDERYPDFEIIHTGGVGMAGAVQAGWTATMDEDYTIHLEEDMVLTRKLPIAEAATVLHTHPMTIAQMAFRREPWWGSPEEVEHGDQLKAIIAQASWHEVKRGYTLHNFLFTLNPCLIPRQVINMGWPSGPLGIGNESGKTAQCLASGMVFGSWGSPDDGHTYARHIGENRGPSWAL